MPGLVELGFFVYRHAELRVEPRGVTEMEVGPFRKCIFSVKRSAQ